MNRLNSMQIFVEVARAAGFSAAANKIGLSRAQVSKSVMHGIPKAPGIRGETDGGLDRILTAPGAGQ